MPPANWKRGWRLWSSRSFTDALDTRTGDRVVLAIRHAGTGATIDRFGPNVGQPDPSPPIHALHRDLPDLASGLRLGCWTPDGCHELELDREEVHLRLILADSRSLACGPSDDAVIRRGALLAHVECPRKSDAADVWFEVRSREPLQKALHDGDGDYWRGRVWPPMSYLVWAGLRQYDPAGAATLAESCRAIFDEEWDRHGHVHENYSATTGEGEPAPGVHARTCPMYCWGGLLLLPDTEGRTGGAIARLPVIGP